MPAENPFLDGPEPLVRRSPGAKTGKRLGPLAALLWLWEPQRRGLVAAVGGVALFAAGMFAGSVVQKRSAASQAANVAPVLAPPAGPPPTRPGGQLSATSFGQAAPEQGGVRFSGRWVEAGGSAPRAAADEFAGPPPEFRPHDRMPEGEKPAEPAAPEGQGPGQGQEPRRQAFAPTGFKQEKGINAVPGVHVDSPEAPKEEQPRRAAPLAAIPAAGAAREVQRAPPPAQGKAATGKFGAEPTAAQQVMTSDGVNQIQTDAGKSFAIMEGKGPHSPETGNGGAGAPSSGSSGDGPVQVNLGGGGGGGNR